MKNQNGITLIALVITIIVLLILAGVSIAMLTGDNGLLTKSQVAAMDNAIGGANDTISTEVQAAMATYLQNKYSNADNSSTATVGATVATHLANRFADFAEGTTATINGCTVELDSNTSVAKITITKGTRTMVGNIDTTTLALKWDAITDVASADGE